MSNDFKRLRSLISKKEVWQAASALSDHLCLIKLNSDTVYPGMIAQITPEGVWIKFDETKLQRSEFLDIQKVLPIEILGYLNSKDERYYFLGKLLSSDSFRVTSISIELFVKFQYEMYKLDRRSNFRVKLPEKDLFAAQISHINGKSCDVNSVVRDISGGGLRLAFDPQDKTLEIDVDSKLRGAFFPFGDKKVPFEGCVRHVQRSDEVFECGIMVTEEVIKSSHRLLALALIIQRKQLR